MKNVGTSSKYEPPMTIVIPTLLLFELIEDHKKIYVS
jgi:hypothetical protein